MPKYFEVCLISFRVKIQLPFFCSFRYLFLYILSILFTGTIKFEFSCFSYADLFVLLFTCISFLSSSHLNIFCSFCNFKDFPFVSPYIFGIFSLANPFSDSNVHVMLSPLHCKCLQTNDRQTNV